MDPLSQAVIGATLAMSCARREHQRVACLAGAIGGLVPDIDVVIRSAQDPLLALEFHRHFTHSLILVPVLGALLGWVLSLVPSLKSLRCHLIAYTILGVATHGVLDACTSYGTQLYWPFSNSRVAWHLIAIIDPIPTLSALCFAAWACVCRSPWKARLGFSCFVAYLSICWVQRERALDHQASLIAERGQVASRQVVMPTLFNNIVFRSVYEADGQFYLDALRVPWWGKASKRVGEKIAALDRATVTAALPEEGPQRRDLERFSWFADHYLGYLSDGRVTDVRYSMAPESAEPLWWITFHPSESSRHVTFGMGRSFGAEARGRFLEFLFDGK